MKVYVDRDHGLGSGPRIFVPYKHLAHETLRDVLNQYSMWGGPDKDTGKAKAWEFPANYPGRLTIALMKVAAMGFAVVRLQGHHDEVYP